MTRVPAGWLPISATVAAGYAGLWELQQHRAPGEGLGAIATRQQGITISSGTVVKHEAGVGYMVRLSMGRG